MKKFLLFISFTGILGINTYAQSLKYGAFLGINISKMKFTDGLTVKGESLAGPKIAAVIESNITDQISIMGLPGISVKGTKLYGSKISLTYLDIPVYAIYNYEVGSGKAFGGLGPYFGIALMGKDGGEKIDFSDDGIKRADFGANFILGYEFTELGLKALMTISPGLGNLSSDSDTKVKNFTFGIGAAYIFGR